MNCANCGSEIWTCATCHEVCAVPACADCASLGEAPEHERRTVVLPQLNSTLLDP